MNRISTLMIAVLLIAIGMAGCNQTAEMLPPAKETEDVVLIETERLSIIGTVIADVLVQDPRFGIGDDNLYGVVLLTTHGELNCFLPRGTDEADFPYIGDIVEASGYHLAGHPGTEEPWEWQNCTFTYIPLSPTQ